jgi:hypothetical protein
LEDFALPLIGALIDVEAERQLRFPSPDVAIKLPDSEDIEAVKPDVTILPLADVVGEQAVAVIVGRWLCELARTRDVAASHVEPMTLHPPLRNVRHDWTPSRKMFQRHAARVTRGCALLGATRMLKPSPARKNRWEITVTCDRP